MERMNLEQELSRYLSVAAGNRIGTSDGPIFDAPLLGVAAADDPLFLRMKDWELVGGQLILPSEWLPTAKTVVSVFFPLSEAVRKSNRTRGQDISPEWTYGQIEGQKIIEKTMDHLAERMNLAGYPSVVPSNDPRFWAGKLHGRHTSFWSERHAAYIAGLGTFGLSRGLITRRGIAGRFGSLITAASFMPDERDYDDVFQYCTRCGACVRNCPSGAISIEHGKDNLICAAFLDELTRDFGSRRGCGKCQVGVPCENKVPALRHPSKR